MAGGTNGGMHRLRTVEKYNPRTRRWTLIAPMIHPRSNFCMQVVEGAITVCGGYDGTGVLPACEVYNKVPVYRYLRLFISVAELPFLDSAC